MGKAILFIGLFIAFCWVVSKLIKALPELFLFMYQFSGTIFLLLGWLFWESSSNASGKGGWVLLQILTLFPFYIMFLAKIANRLHGENGQGVPNKLTRGGMFSMTTVFFPIGMLARKMAALDAQQKAQRNARKHTQNEDTLKPTDEA